MSAPVDPKAVEMWISGLGNILLEQKDAELTALRTEVAVLKALIERLKADLRYYEEQADAPVVCEGATE